RSTLGRDAGDLKISRMVDGQSMEHCGAASAEEAAHRLHRAVGASIGKHPHSATSILGVGFGVFPRPLLLLTDEGDAPAHTVIRRDEVLRTQPAARDALCDCLPGGELRAQVCWKRARCLRHSLTVLPVSATDGAVQREWGEAAVLGECGGVLA